MSADDDPVTRNRATHPRRTPGRTPLGDHLMPALYASAAASIVIATIVLVIALTK